MIDLIIIGNGIAAQCFLWELSKSDKKISVLKISDERLAPSCSLNSTATISLRGAVRGVSPLGDLNFDSYKMAEAFIGKERPDGVVSSKFYSLCEEEEKEEYVRRFGYLEEIRDIGPLSLKKIHQGNIWDGYIIDPGKFLGFFQERTKKFHSSISAMVTATKITDEGVAVTTLDGNVYIARKLLICSGAYTKLYEALYPAHLAIKGSSSVPGAYLEKSGVDLGSTSFVVSLHGENLIYYSQTKTLKIGATTQKKGLEAPEYLKLLGIWESFHSLFKEKIPKFSEFEIKVGLRHKGIKRMPFYGKLSENVFALMSLYKNGYTYPFLGAKEILKLM